MQGQQRNVKKKEEKKKRDAHAELFIYLLQSPSQSRKVPKYYGNNDGDSCENVT